MKKKIIVLISAISLILSGCSSPEVDIIINADGYEGIVLATENTAPPPVSIPIVNLGDYSTETASDGSDSEPEDITSEPDNSSEKEEPPVTAYVPPEPVIVTQPEITTTTTVYTEITTTTATTTTTITTTVTTSDEATTSLEEEPPNTDLTPIMGTSIATVEQMRAFILAVNPDVDQRIIDMIPYYLSEGAAEGVRGDIAFAQSCVETGYFKFDKAGTGSAVTIDDNNFCGLGVTELGKKGCIFETPQLGIRAQIQHLKAYGSTLPLNGEQVDPRFHYVVRGCAKYWEWLGMQENPEGRGWAGGKNYGPIILDIFCRVLQY